MQVSKLTLELNQLTSDQSVSQQIRDDAAKNHMAELTILKKQLTDQQKQQQDAETNHNNKVNQLQADLKTEQNKEAPAAVKKVTQTVDPKLSSFLDFHRFESNFQSDIKAFKLAKTKGTDAPKPAASPAKTPAPPAKKN